MLWSTWPVCVLSAWAATDARAQAAVATGPGIGLVLCGGGARGAARVGELQVLEELRFGGQLGADPSLFAEIYQPLDPGARYFVSALADYDITTINVFEPGERVSEYRTSQGGLTLAVGRNYDTWGELRLGYRRYVGDAEVRVGDPSLKDYTYDTGQAFLRMSWDRFDNTNFPHRGLRGNFELTASRRGLGAEEDFDQPSLRAVRAATWGRHTSIGGVRLGTTLESNAPPQSLFRIGGFGSRAGLQEEELSGQHFGIVSLAFYRRIFDL